VHNNQRDGFHRQAIPRGRVAYEPNSVAGGCPFQAGTQGFMSFAEPVEESKVRGKPERFAEHYNQATLFWNSQTDVEKAHIIRAFRFELTKVQISAIRARVVAQLRNVAEDLARAVADGLGIVELPDALPLALERPPKPEVKSSGYLSLFAHPGTEGIKTRRIAILVANGVDGETLTELHSSLLQQGAIPRFVGVKLGQVSSVSGAPLNVEITMETAPAVLWDALILPDGTDATEALLPVGNAIEFIKEQYRHCKAILALGASRALVEASAIPSKLRSGERDRGLLIVGKGDPGKAITDFIEAVASHRSFARETDPPAV